MIPIKELNIVHLFPDLLNLYGDRGNIMVLKKRCMLRGIAVRVTECLIGDTVSVNDADIVFLGGGSDREQKLVCNKLLSIRDELSAYGGDGGVILAVCGGYQLLGHCYMLEDEVIRGLALCDFETRREKGRLIGNIAIDSEFGRLVGFENHSGRTTLSGDAKPLGNVVSGFGNNGIDKTEGILHNNIFGTYLHGPLLPKNPVLADELIRRSLMRKYGSGDLEALPQTFERQARDSVIFK